MGIEFIGMIQPRNQSEIHPPRGPAIDIGYVRALAQAHEEGGFDRFLIGWHSNGPDGLQLAAYAAAHTRRVGFLVAHRPGFQAPTTAARSFSTLDQLSEGRTAIHVITGGDDTDQQRDGDYLHKNDRYARTDEYVGILKSIWTASAPVDHADGYIHFSTVDQVRETAAKHFAGQNDLLLVAVDPSPLGAALRYEPSRGGALFPHLYAPLPLTAVRWVKPLPRGADGAHVFPDLIG